MAEYQIRRCERRLEGGIHPETHKELSTADPCLFIDDPEAACVSNSLFRGRTR